VPRPANLHAKTLASLDPLCSGDSGTGAGTTLPGVQAGDVAGLGALLDNLLALSKDQLDVAGVGHVGVNLAKSVCVLSTI
jgi:hypothetical protein